MYSASASLGLTHHKLSSEEKAEAELTYIRNMCIDLSTKSNSTVDDFIATRRGLTKDTITTHYKSFITKLQQESPQDFVALTLATYLRISTEKGFTRINAAFILNLSLSTLKDRYNNYIARNQGISRN